MCKVVNKRDGPHQVYIGRGSVWGNPFKIDEAYGHTRAVVIAMYKLYLWKKIVDGEITKDMLVALDGKTLGCYCYPMACHGDVIVQAVKWAKGEIS